MANDAPGPSKKIRFCDTDFESTGLRWLDEIENEMLTAIESDEDSASESIYEPSEHDTDTEQEGEEEEFANTDEQEDSEDYEEPVNQASKKSRNFYGKNRFKWSSESFTSRSRTPKHNIVLRLPTLRGSASLLGHEAQPFAVWNLLITDDMLKTILHWTNEKIKKQRANLKNSSRSEHQDLDIVELKAFIGLLFYSAIFVSNHENISRIFATDGTGREIFRCVMSKQRFAFLLACLRFDNSLDRNIRKQENPLAAISELFDQFIKNCQTLYSLGVNCCIDEMLVSFRGRCRFKMYMPNKPCKYGIKIVCMTDARTHYFFNGYIYTGKDSDGFGLEKHLKKFNKPTQSVLRLVQPIAGSNRNITADNWFTSLELVEQLKNRKLTYVGTVKKNKKEIPPDFLPKKTEKLVRMELYLVLLKT
ncbi:piggyBac transposable element-derived protein 3-like [Anthonomus grandis grandis]|uniref:piggyBac transposable element-derived protein 3-like n=1 Tax=Anthonomus grandis grandis TaxID=2921223 RepID=UPI00216650CA|nr:piggyBac transposable element-derived protein 3-like [Anthonomus grandis grandis]